MCPHPTHVTTAFAGTRLPSRALACDHHHRAIDRTRGGTDASSHPAAYGRAPAAVSTAESASGAGDSRDPERPDRDAAAPTEPPDPERPSTGSEDPAPTPPAQDFRGARAVQRGDGVNLQFNVFNEGPRPGPETDQASRAERHPPRRAEPAMIARTESKSRRTANVATRVTAGLIAFVVLALFTTSLPDVAQRVVEILGTALVVWRVNGQDLEIARSLTTFPGWQRPEKWGEERAIAQLEPGSWFCHEDEYQAMRTQEAHHRRQSAEHAKHLAERDTNTTRAYWTKRRQLDREDWYRDWKDELEWRRFQTEDRPYPPDPFIPRSSEEKDELAWAHAQAIVAGNELAPLHQEPVHEPVRQLAVTVIERDDGTWAIGCHNGNVLEFGADDVLRVKTAQLPAPPTDTDDRSAEQMQSILELLKALAERDAPTQVPAEVRLPWGDSPQAAWQFSRALRAAAQWGLLQVRRMGPFGQLPGFSRAVIGVDVRWDDVHLELILTPAGRLWLDAERPPG